METFEETPFLGAEGVGFTTSKTGLASVVWVDIDNPNTLTDGFVFDKVLELSESPAVSQPVQNLTLTLDGYSISDFVEVFHHNTAPPIQWFNYLFAYPLVEISHKPVLSARNPFEFPSGRFCAFGLKFTPQPMEPSKFSLNSLEESSIAGNSEVVYSNINPQGMFAVISRGDAFGNNYVQEQFTFLIDKVCCPNPPIEIPQEVSGNLDWNFKSSFDRAEGDPLGFESKRTSIIANSKVFLDLRLRNPLPSIPSCPDRFKYLIRIISANYHELSGKLGKFSNKVVGSVMEFKLTAERYAITHINYILSRVRILFHSLKRISFRGSLILITALHSIVTYRKRPLTTLAESIGKVRRVREVKRATSPHPQGGYALPV